MAAHGLTTVRDGLRWHLVEASPGRFDWSSWLPQLRAARAAGVQVVWDLCHYGLPDGVDPFTPAFVERFEAFARAAAVVARAESDDVPWWCPVNEISFWSWAGGDAGFFPPFAHARGFELKVQLARAAIAAARAVRDVDPRARLLWAEPAIHVACDPSRPGDADAAEGHRLAQYQAYDLVAGRLWPQAGGAPDLLDVVGVNYYPTNQWIHGGPPIAPDHALARSFAAMLVEVWERYRRPLVVAETGTEGAARAPWLRAVAAEVARARAAGAPVEGVCWYPVTDHPGWDDDRHCPNGLLGYADAAGRRPVEPRLAVELARCAAVPERAPGRAAEPAWLASSGG